MPGQRRLAAILSADAEGYSRLMGDDEAATLRTLSVYREAMTALIQHHRGRVVDMPGDNVLAEFASVVDAVQCAVGVQRQLEDRNAELPTQRRMHFRIGINVGDVIVEGQQIYGDAVNVAARVERLAPGGGICIAGTAYDQIENKLALRFEYLGERQLKNVAQPVRVYRIDTDPGAPAARATRAPASGPGLPDRPSIAVLPFVNMSGDPEQEYFSDGVTEDLITDLCRLSGMLVIARNSTFLYKGKTVKVEEVGRELGVRYVLEGSVRRGGDRVRVTAQLVEATSGFHLWAERYDRPVTDIFAVQDDITQQIVSNLGEEVWRAELARARRVPTASLTAYDCLLRGRDEYHRFTRDALREARRLYEQAILLDPQYAAAYAMLGWTHRLEWSWQWSPDSRALERMIELAQTALLLDDSLPGAHLLLSSVHLWRRRHDEAVAEAEKALALSPNSAQVHYSLADAMNFVGKPEDAIRYAEQAMRLDPRNREVYMFEAGWAYVLMRRYEEAMAAIKTGLGRYPNSLGAHSAMAVIYSELGREEEAQAEAAEILRISPEYSLAVARERLPYKDPATLQRRLDALRRSGLK